MAAAKKQVKRVRVAQKLGPVGQVIEVAFRSSIAVANYQHIHIEMRSTVGSGETHSEALDRLRVLVAVELKRARDGEIPEMTAKKFTDLLK